MLIVVTDEGRVWNHNSPVLEQYADCVLVVCLNGKAVTDKYKCFVSPYTPRKGMGMIDQSITGEKYRALESVSEKLRREFSYHDDIVFLTDEEPESLYPYLVLNDMHTYNRYHLWCMLPMRFEGRRRRALYSGLLEDFKKASSVICFDDNFLDLLPRESRTFSRIFDALNEYAYGLLPTVLCDIENHMDSMSRFYFDFNAKRYIEIDNAYEAVLKMTPLSEKEISECKPQRMYSTLGLIRMFEENPNSSPDAKQRVEKLYPRDNGKDICNQLKAMRQALADANRIDFQTVECPSTGPCAGTCPWCDEEIRYLSEQLEKIPWRERIYPETKVENLHTGYRPIDPPSESTDCDDVSITMGIFKIFDRGESNE